MAKYSLSYVDGTRVNSDQIIRAFDDLGMTTPRGLIDITLHGIRYSYQDYDVLSACMKELAKMRGPETATASWVASL